MKTLLALLLSTAGLTAQVVTNYPFIWDSGTNQPPGSATGWRFWEKGPAGSRVLLGATTGETNRFFTVSNYILGTTRSFAVTSTNMHGESPESVPYVVPVPPATPTNLHPVTSSITTEVPGVIEISENLVDWSQRIRLAQSSQPNSVVVQIVQYPHLPLLFMRSKALAMPSLLPIP